MRFSMPHTQLFLCFVALTFTGCDSSDNGSEPADNGNAQEAQGPGPSRVTADGKVDMSAHAVTIHKMTREMVNLMEDVMNKEIMRPPLKVSDVRNAFFERLDWIDQMSDEDVAKMRQATADLDSLIAEIRAHENAAGDQALEARLKKIESWNQSIKAGIPQ